jgi:predicted transposase/invertase (TIGR01784 family)
MDFMFKQIFADARDLSDLALLLSGTFGKPIKEEELKIVSPILAREQKDGKDCVLDLNAKMSDGTNVIIEIQLHKKGDFVKRAAFYASGAYYKQMRQSEDYNELDAVISINFIDFELFEDSENYRSDIVSIIKQTGKEISTGFNIIFVELQKARKICDNTDKLLPWAKLIAAKTEEEAKMLATQEPKLKHAAERVIRLSEDESMQLLYEAQEKAKRDRRAEDNYVRNEGIAIGEERGRMAEKRETARSLKSLGSAPDFIAKATGLSIEEIEKL